MECVKNSLYSGFFPIKALRSGHMMNLQVKSTVTQKRRTPGCLLPIPYTRQKFIETRERERRLKIHQVAFKTLPVCYRILVLIYNIA